MDQNTDIAQQPRSRTGEVAGAAKDQASDVMETASEQMRSVKNEAQDHVQELMSDARAELRSQAEQRAREAATTLRQMSEQLRTMAGSIDHDSTLASLSRQASESTRGLADRLEHGGIDRLGQDLARRARERPGTFLLGCMAAGVVVGRVMRDVAPVAGSQPEANNGSTNGWNEGMRSELGADLRQPMPDVTGVPSTSTMPTAGSTGEGRR